MTEVTSLAGRTPWGRVAAESFAIVFSILLAFWIDASWTERLERQEEQEILSGLDGDFQRLSAELDGVAERYDAIAGQVEWLLDVAAREEAPSVAQMDTAMFGVIWAGTFDSESSTLEAVLQSGRLELIESAALRTALAGWGAVYAETRDNQIAMREYAIRVLVPYLASQGLQVGRPQRASRFMGEAWQLDLGSEADASDAYRRVLADPEFTSLAQYHYSWSLWSAIEFRRAAERAREILQLVRAALP